MCSYIGFHLTISQSHIYTLMRLDDGGVDRVMIKYFRNNNASTRERLLKTSKKYTLYGPLYLLK
ncbi:hypothetical protein HanXRQr2_Chr09g0372431 [Helianthus annuus]|uniref:Uncharacterized protein n=1 Tax=Helianthus annuus TaxID=4232 RepID=A0A9K3I3H2_HELAN|nr:hypothetical protein HanXRQr2_Chr09g0372431 [Helianthus annuus]